MPGLPTSNPSQFIQGAPVLHVRNVVRTAEFYRDVLGFVWDFGDASYAVVWRDNSAIHLVAGEQDPTGIHLFQWVKDVDAYRAEIAGRGATIVQDPVDRPYGLREMVLRDVNGIEVVFGQDID
ncbi:MAG TPA: glyoxalase superfamily protein [Pseudomonadales bacterium]